MPAAAAIPLLWRPASLSGTDLISERDITRASVAVATFLGNLIYKDKV